MARTLSPQLSRSGGAELVEAHRRCRELLRAAAALADASRHDPRVVACDDADCVLPALGCDAEVCTLVRRLGLLADSGGGSVGNAEVALRGFLMATRQAVDAVRICRQTAHTSGFCWFSDTTGADGCGEVLQLAHRLG